MGDIEAILGALVTRISARRHRHRFLQAGFVQVLAAEARCMAAFAVRL